MAAGCADYALSCPNNCSSRGQCDPASGFCSCIPGYVGDCMCPGNCSNHGACQYQGGTAGSCVCDYGFSGTNCSTVESLHSTTLVSYSIAKAPARVCYADNFSATISIHNLPSPDNSSATTQFSVSIRNSTNDLVLSSTHISGSSWPLDVPSLPVGAYVLTVVALDTLGRGPNYRVFKSHSFEVTQFAVVALSTEFLSMYHRPDKVEAVAHVAESGCILNPDITFLWTVSDSNGGIVQLPSPTLPRLVLPPFSLLPATTYQATVKASYNLHPSASLATVTTDLVVGRSPISAHFLEGSAMTVNLPFALNVVATDPDQAGTDFGYSWVVNQVGQTFNLAILGTVNNETITMPAGSIFSGQTVTYMFTCTVSKPNVDPAVVSSLVTVVPAASAVPSVTITGDTTKVNADEVLGLLGNASHGATLFEWSATPAVNMNRTTAGSSATSKDLYLLGGTLTPGTTYVFTLKSKFSVTGVWGQSSVTIECNAPPSAGIFTVSHSNPISSLETEVLFSASNFDDLDAPIEYQFEYELNGKRNTIRPWSTVSSFSSKFLPEGSVLPVMKAKDTRGAISEVRLGCHSFVLNGQLATNSPQCSATHLTIQALSKNVNESTGQAVDRQMAHLKVDNMPASSVLAFVSAGILAVNADSSSSTVSTRMTALNILTSVASRSGPEQASAVIRSVASDVTSLQDPTLRQRTNDLADTVLDLATNDGLTSEASANILEVIGNTAKGTRASSGFDAVSATRMTTLLDKLVKAAAKRVEVNAPTTLIDTPDIKMALKTVSSELSAGLDAGSGGSVMLPAVSVLPASSGRRLLSEYPVTLSLNILAPATNPRSTSMVPLRSGLSMVELIRGDQVENVANLPAGHEIEVCMQLTQSTNASKCVYGVDGGGWSDQGMSTVGVSKATDYPIVKNAGDTVCCKTSHLSDFAIAEALYVTTWLPSKNQVNVSKTTNIELTFNLPIQLGTGSVVITPVGGQGVNTPRSIPITDSRISISASNTTLVIDFSADLDDRSDKQVQVTLPAGAVLDQNGFAYEGFNGTIYSFTLQDETGPIVTTVTPTSNELYVDVGTNITFYFYETIVQVGNISIWPENDMSALVQLPPGDSQVNIVGGTLVINLATPLFPGTKYSIGYDGNAIHDNESPFNFASAQQTSFTTRVRVLSSLPAASRTNVMQTSPIQFTLDGVATRGTGKVVISANNPAPIVRETHTHVVTYEIYKYYVDDLPQPPLKFTVGHTYVFDLNHQTMSPHPLVLKFLGVVHDTDVTYELDGVVVDYASWLSLFQNSLARTLTIQPTQAINLEYDRFSGPAVGGTVEVTIASSLYIDLGSTAVTSDGVPEVALAGNVVTITPVVPLPASQLVTVTVSSGVIANLEAFSLSFTTCSCVCTSSSPYEVQADRVGTISSGVDLSGPRTCQWRLLSDPGSMISLSIQQLHIPTVNGTTNWNCGSDYLELRDGSSKDAKLVWRKCGIAPPDLNQVFHLTSNSMHLMLVTSGTNNASFVANYDSARELQMVLVGPSTDSPPVMVGSDLTIRWFSIAPIPKSMNSWIALYKQGTCDDDNEWRHHCYLASQTLQGGLMQGEVKFRYAMNGNNGYISSGYYDVRFFSGSSQGHTCNAHNRQMTDNDATEYSRCQLQALSTVEVYIAPPGSVPNAHVPGSKEFDSRYQMW